jgi:hypothetical protein
VDPFALSTSSLTRSRPMLILLGAIIDVIEFLDGPLESCNEPFLFRGPYCS